MENNEVWRYLPYLMVAVQALQLLCLSLTIRSESRSRWLVLVLDLLPTVGLVLYYLTKPYSATHSIKVLVTLICSILLLMSVNAGSCQMVNRVQR